MRLTLEKVLILKSVGMFSETQESSLAEVATILEEIEYKAGQRILEKGDIGRSMFIIIEGKVQVHDGERTIAILGKRDVFGELAVLETETRSASITAIEDTSLFRLDQAPFYELMAEHSEVARGIIRMLCQRVKSFLDTK